MGAPQRDQAAALVTAAAEAEATPSTGTSIPATAAASPVLSIQVIDVLPVSSETAMIGNGAASSGHEMLLELEGVTLRTPNGATTLVEGLDVKVGN